MGWKKGVWKDIFLDIGYDIVGTGIFSIGINVFTAPSNIAPGGVSGIATMLNYLFGLPIGLGSFLLNAPLLLLALKFLGKTFTLKTLKTVAINTVMMDCVAAYIPQYQGNPLLAALFGGVLMGVGLAVVFLRGSTTGGGDIAGKLIQLKMPHIQLGKAMMFFDFVVIALSAVVYGSIENPLYAIIAIFASSRMIDTVLYGMDTGKLALIISKRNEEIAAMIISELDRSATFLKGHGAFSKENKETLICAVRRQEYPKLKKLILKIDPDAFVITTEASEILGEGFKPIDKE